ncbi:hypothetical protein VTH06DRAFT_7803 [Thermothelomyces fergusii]
MSTFNAHLHNLLPDSGSSGAQGAAAAAQGRDHNHNHNPHAVPNPSDTSALFRLLQDQMGTLATTAPTEGNRAFLQSLVEAFLDGLDRVPRRALRGDDACPICAERYLDDPYCLVVELPCHASHRFDLECVGPWLRAKGTCPLCRKELGRRKEAVAAPKQAGEEEDEDDDMNGLYA